MGIAFYSRETARFSFSDKDLPFWNPISINWGFNFACRNGFRFWKQDNYITTYKAEVKTIKIEINNMITELNLINSKLSGYGQTTIHHGTHHDHEDEDGQTASMGVKLTTESQTTEGQTTYMSSGVPTKKMTPYRHTSSDVTTTIIP